MTDPIADFLTRLRNANSAYHDEVTLPHSKIKANIAEILKAEGYITDYRTEDARVGKSLVVAAQVRPEPRAQHRRPAPGVQARSAGVREVHQSAAGARRPGRGDHLHVLGPAHRPSGSHDRAWAAKSSPTSGEGEIDMSRIGKQPVPVPAGVDVTIDGQNVSVKGPKGTLDTGGRRADRGRRATTTAPSW